MTTRSDAIANPLRKLSSDSQTSSKPAASSVQVNKKGEWNFRNLNKRIYKCIRFKGDINVLKDLKRSSDLHESRLPNYF